MITVFLRTVILYFFIMAGLRLLGKRQIGELEPGELVLTMMLSDLATVPMQDLGIPLLSGLIPILTLLCCSLLLSQLAMKSVTFRRLTCGSPSVLIRGGKISQEAMRANRITLDELMEQLRIHGCSQLSEVEYAILENSGQVSILPAAEQRPLSPAQLGFSVTDAVTLPTIVISDGRLLRDALRRCGKTEAWVQQQLKNAALSRISEVFLMTVDETDQVLLVPREVTP